MDKLRQQYMELLQQAGFPVTSEANAFSHSIPLVKAVIYSALYPNVVHLGQPTDNRKTCKFLTNSNCSLKPHPRSCCSDEKIFAHRWLAYSEKMKITSVFCNGVTMVTSTALILLGDTPTYLEVDSAPTGRTSRNTGSQASKLSSLVVGGWMVIQTKAEDAALLLHVHKAVEDMLMCSVASPTHGYREPHTDSIVSSLAGLIHRSETGESLPSSPIANTMSLYTSRYPPLIPTASHISSTGKASLLLYRPPALRSSSYGSLPEANAPLLPLPTVAAPDTTTPAVAPINMPPVPPTSDIPLGSQPVERRRTTRWDSDRDRYKDRGDHSDRSRSRSPLHNFDDHSSNSYHGNNDHRNNAYPSNREMLGHRNRSRSRSPLHHNDHHSNHSYRGNHDYRRNSTYQSTNRYHQPPPRLDDRSRDGSGRSCPPTMYQNPRHHNPYNSESRY